MSVNKQLDEILEDWKLFELDEYVAKDNFKQSILALIASEREQGKINALVQLKIAFITYTLHTPVNEQITPHQWIERYISNELRSIK